ncbi:type I-F CRISPR-associated helicase Cas3f [Pseudorhodoferax sp.]|uniref:type I-F CRISPR-associated helicase Cas3f n=1 Tax=Pseudorhodoferax sp. TaxID=1993553 RepID=UPI002DD6571D|nr:type I-F CRISPR-associated helicase Cas3f [Pseudorhodoferax sp.]
MNVLLVSQCDKRALTETRRILDQFAERRGERTWQTPITQDGLDTLRRLLRKTARKNTAVACHWIRGLDHSELLWVVGDRGRFNAEGAVPTNTTTRNVLRARDENGWHTGEDIRLLASLAGLLHDLGKASEAFQSRLTQGAKAGRNIFRHEWASLRLFQAFVGGSSDVQWLQRLAEPSDDDDASWLGRLQRDDQLGTDKPFTTLPPLARAIGWLVLTHHRLPVMPERDERGLWRLLGVKVRGFRTGQLDQVLDKIDASWNELPELADPAAVEPYWRFTVLPVTASVWRRRMARVARQLLKRHQPGAAPDWTTNPYVMHLARLSLMLADHHYSRLKDDCHHLREKGDKGFPLHANTDPKTGRLCQPLDEHLIGVGKHASLVAHALPGVARNLPVLKNLRALRRRAANERFRWQDKAADLATGLRERARRQGAFIVNMASTGCGKTLGNVRVMHALAEPAQGWRCAVALGLRSLSLQTGRALRELLGLNEDEVGLLVGGGASRELFEIAAREAEASGSASSMDLLPDADGQHVLTDMATDDPLLSRLTNEAQVRSLLAVPLLVSTVDHLMPACESQRGGHQIVPMLRLMSGDLVLDELDDYDIDDLPALARLVYWAGVLGARVLVSSATLPPALVQGMFMAYREGRGVFQRNRGERPGAPAEPCCAWIDEFNAQAQDCADAAAFEAAHLRFVQQRHGRLGQQEPLRRLCLVDLSSPHRDRLRIRQTFSGLLRDQIAALHVLHRNADPVSGKQVSFGLVRMANIEPLVDVALALFALGAPKGLRLHLCVYHAQFPLLLRSAIERRLDAAFDRRLPDEVFQRPDIRLRIDAYPETEQVFVVLASPVCEVGRDWDADWAIAEPSSMRSLIQLAGRVRRHRAERCSVPNVAVFGTNLRHLEQPGKAAFCRPGFERDDGPFRLDSHQLQALLHSDEKDRIDARPRILPQPAEALRPQQWLTDLEHARLQAQMLPPPPPAPLTARELRIGKKPGGEVPLNAAAYWLLPQAHLVAVLPQQQPFREDNVPDVELVLLPDEDQEHTQVHRLVDEKGQLYALVDSSLDHGIPAAWVQGEGINPWGGVGYLDELMALADERRMSLQDCARRYGRVTVPESAQGWRFHPLLGFTKQA